MRQRKIYWKDIWESFLLSKGRVVSIIALMALGSFALVGLKVSSLDIRTTGVNFFERYQTADLFVISDYGLNQSDIKLLEQLNTKAVIEYGYFVDATIDETDDAFRIFSNSNTISQYELVSGEMPTKVGEIAISNAYSTIYQIGDNIYFNENDKTESGNVLITHEFTITGFVNSSEILSSINLGQSTAGTGDLKGYAVVPDITFDSEVYMIARMSYHNLAELSPFEQTYLDLVYQNKQEVKGLFNLQPEDKLATLVDENQSKIDDGYDQIEQAKQELREAQEKISDSEVEIKDGESQLSDAIVQIEESAEELEAAWEQLVEGGQVLSDSYEQLNLAKQQLDTGWQQLSVFQQQLDDAAYQINSVSSILESKKIELDQAEQLILQANEQLNMNNDELSKAKELLDSKAYELTKVKEQLDQTQISLQIAEEELANARLAIEQQVIELNNNGIDPDTVEELVIAKEFLLHQENELQQAQLEYNAGLEQYEEGKNDWLNGKREYETGYEIYLESQNELAEKEKEYQKGLDEYTEAESLLETKKQEYYDGIEQYNTAYYTLLEKQMQYNAGINEYNAGLTAYDENLKQYYSGEEALGEARETLVTKREQLKEAKELLQQKKQEYEKAKKEADEEIDEKELELQEAQEKVNQLALPTYFVYTRREIPGSEGYLSYENNASIIDNVGNIFPIFLYFVAAMVSFTTMTRFVDEERLTIGTFRALGYTKRDIVLKFVIYGIVTSLVGTAIGALLGHTLLPYIIYSTYQSKIILSPIELYFYPWHTLVAIILGFISTVFPILIVLRRTLLQKPSQLLLPKPPVSGDKIFLERFVFLWKKLSFTKKVTMRNIFRYKQRMLMTIFGVCGSVALLFTGLGVQSSISDLNNRQFNDIIKYDMIVTKNSYLTENEIEEIELLTHNTMVQQNMAIHYETVTKIAGDKNDTQNITLIVPKGEINTFDDYIQLFSVEDKSSLTLPNDGVIISEKLAKLTGVSVGDRLIVQNQNDENIEVMISGVAEMYMNHFMVMTPSYYQQVFAEEATENAILIRLNDVSTSATNQMAALFMKLSGVETVVQNTILKEQVNIIVESINLVMYVLIITSVLLSVVILYNLTNINVAERMRELCTIKVLGFYDQEVTLYIYRETILLSFVGIVAGTISGLLFHRYMIEVIPPDTILFNSYVGKMTYVVPTLLVVAILIVLGIVVRKWLEKVDMLEALKSVE